MPSSGLCPYGYILYSVIVFLVAGIYIFESFKILSLWYFYEFAINSNYYEEDGQVKGDTHEIQFDL
jgi:hypothetical protein